MASLKEIVEIFSSKQLLRTAWLVMAVGAVVVSFLNLIFGPFFYFFQASYQIGFLIGLTILSLLLTLPKLRSFIIQKYNQRRNVSYVVLAIFLALFPFLISPAPWTNTRYIVVLPFRGDSRYQTIIANQIAITAKQTSLEQINVLTPRCLPAFLQDMVETCFSTIGEQWLLDRRIVLVIDGEVVIENDVSLVNITYKAMSSNLELLPNSLPDTQYNSPVGWSESPITLSQQYFKSVAPSLSFFVMSRLEKDTTSKVSTLLKARDTLPTRGINTNTDTLWTIYEAIVRDLVAERDFREARITFDRIRNIFDGQTRFYLLGGFLEEQAEDFQLAQEYYQKVLQRDPKSIESLRGLGRVYYSLHRYVDTICYFSEIKELGSISEANTWIAAAYDRLNQSLKAQDIRQEKIEDQIGDSIGRINRAREHSLNNNYDKAIDELQNVLDKEISSTSHAEAQFLLGVTEAQQDHYAEAIDAFQKLIDEFGKNASFIDLSLQASIWKGNVYLQWGRPEDAYNEFLGISDSIKDLNQLAQASYLRDFAISEVRTNRYSSAVEHYKEAISLITNQDTPLYGNILNEYSSALRSINEMTEADKISQEASEVYEDIINNSVKSANEDFQGCDLLNQIYNYHPSRYQDLRQFLLEPPLVIPASYYLQRRYTYYGIGDVEAAKADAIIEVKIREENPISAVDFYNLGRAYLDANEKDSEKMLHVFQRAIDLDNPGKKDDVADAADYSEMSIVYSRDKNYTASIEVLLQAIALQPNTNIRDSYYFRLGEAYKGRWNEMKNKEDLEKARQAYEVATQVVDGQQVLDFRALGLTLYELGDWEKSISAFNQAIVFDDATTSNMVIDADEYHMMGRSYYELHQWDESIAAFNKAIDLDNPSNTSDSYDAAEYHYIGVIQIQRPDKNFTLAIDALNKAISLDDGKSDAADYYWRGFAYHGLGDNQKALEDLDKCISLDKLNEHQLWIGLAQEVKKQIQ